MTTEPEGLAPAVEQAWTALTDCIFNTAEHGDDEDSYAAWLLDIARARDEFITAIQADYDSKLLSRLLDGEANELLPGEQDVASRIDWLCGHDAQLQIRVEDLEELIRDGLGAAAEEMRLLPDGAPVAAKLALWTERAHKLLHRS